MPTTKPRFTITLEEELFERINRYQHAHKFGSQTKAVIDLIGKGLMREAQTTQKVPVLSGEEITLIVNWRESSTDAKNKIRALLSQPVATSDIPDTPRGYSPITLLSLFDAADFHVKEEVISLLTDHIREKLD